MLVSVDGEVTCWPAALVITSPGTMPFVFAGVPQMTPRISVPDRTGAMLVGEPAGWPLGTQPFGAPNPNWPPCCAACCCCCSCACGLVSVLCAPLLPLATITPTKPDA